MSKAKKTRRSRFEGLSLETLNQEVAKVTQQSTSDANEAIPALEVEKTEVVKRKKGRPKKSNRQPLNTAIEPKNRQRLEFLAMLNGGSIADQLNNILSRYFTEIEQVDELIEVFEARKKKQ